MVSPAKEPLPTAQSPVRPFYVRIAHKIEDFIDDINWIHIAFKLCAYTYILFIAWITWHVLPFPGHWDIGRQSDKIPTTPQDLTNYFDTFAGISECTISASDLYSMPLRDKYGSHSGPHDVFCPNRRSLLHAMSNGGRIGFDAPYIPKDCNYRWYATAETCMILERFDGLVFIGDSSLQTIYNGFNILLRQDLATGALQSWSMSTKAKAECRCNNQFTKSDCSQNYVTASEQVSKNPERGNSVSGSEYACERTPHLFIDINGGRPHQSAIEKFTHIVPKALRSNYKPIPIIHSLSPMTASHDDAASSLLGVADLADASERKTPILWIGPTAAGHVEIKGRKTNQEIWDFDELMAKTAQTNDIEVLKMWNMTVQASTWDGIRFGERVALVQAMMVINWLSRLESS